MKFLADEDLSGPVVRGVRFRLPDIDLVTVLQAGLRGQHDRSVLRWAASQQRVLLTHDETTMPEHAYDLITRGEAVYGVFVVPQSVSIRLAIEEIVLIAECSFEGEYAGQVRYIPL